MKIYNEEPVISVPRFKEGNGFYTTKARSKLMSKIRAKHTKPELLLRKALWEKGLRYRLHNKALPGNPDICFTKYKIAIFIDGEFWHGYNWDEKKERIKTNRDFWIAKIERNMQRDKINTLKLSDMGFKVFRFWEKDLKKSLGECVQTILNYITSKT